MMIYHQSKFGCERIIILQSLSLSLSLSFSRNSPVLIIQALTVTLTLKIVAQFFRTTLWLMMIHHHAKFAYKRLKVVHKISSRQSRTDRQTGTMIPAYSLSSLYGKGGGGCVSYNDLFCNNNNNVLFYVLFLQIRAHSPLARYKNSQNQLSRVCARTHTCVCAQTLNDVPCKDEKGHCQSEKEKKD